MVSPTDLSVTTIEPGVYYILDPECPLSKRYAKYINEMDYGSQKVFVVFTSSEVDKVHTFVKKYLAIEHQLIIDSSKEVIDILGATKYPECFLVDESNHIEYHGLINDWYVNIVRHRPNPSKHYLQDAIRAYESGNEVPITYVEPIGCIIER